MGFYMKRSTKGTIAMLLTALLWSIGGIFIKLVPWGPLAIAGARGLIAGCVVLAHLKFRRLRIEFSKGSALIALALCAVFLSFVAANKLTTAANAIVLQYSGPVYVLLYLAFVRKQKLRRIDIAVVPLAIAGVALCFVGQMGRGTLPGNLVALLSGVFFATMLIVTEDVSEQTRLSGILLGQFLTALVGLPALVVEKPVFTLPAIGGVLMLGLFQVGLAYVLYAEAAKDAPLLTRSLLAVLEPLLNPVWVFLFAGENPGPWSILGGVVVVGAITAWYVLDGRDPGKTAAPEAEKKPDSCEQTACIDLDAVL